MNNTIRVIYHNYCVDGFAAALSAYVYFEEKNQLPQVEFSGATHGDMPPDCSGQHVYILDFSYQREMIRQLCKQAAEVTIIDHHISAFNDLQGLDNESTNLNLIFDMSCSGAVLSWKYFFNNEIPYLFRIVQDNDLWLFEFAETKNIIAAMYSYPFIFTLWKKWLLVSKALEVLKREGEIINRVRNKQITAYKKRARPGIVAEYCVPVVNAPGNLASELLNQLSAQQPFAASYEDIGKTRFWHLRSSGDDAVDVSKIAIKYGGGGHKNASGFRTPITEIVI